MDLYYKFLCLFLHRRTKEFPQMVSYYFSFDSFNHKKVLLHERKRHTARRVKALALLFCLGGGPHPGRGRAYPSPVLPGRGKGHTPTWRGQGVRYPILTWLGVPPFQKGPGKEPRTEVPPQKGPGTAVADPGFGQGGGPRIFFQDFTNIAKQSLMRKANNIIFQYKNLGILTNLFFF